MDSIWIIVARYVIQSKLELSELLLLCERETDIGTRLYVRSLLTLIEFRLGLFLTKVDGWPDSVPLGQFVYWFVRLPVDCGEVGKEILLDNPILAEQCLIVLDTAKSSLATAVEIILSSQMTWPSELHKSSNPLHEILVAKQVIDKMKVSILVHHSELNHCQHDGHLWSYVEVLVGSETQSR